MLGRRWRHLVNHIPSTGIEQPWPKDTAEPLPKRRGKSKNDVAVSAVAAADIPPLPIPIADPVLIPIPVPIPVPVAVRISIPVAAPVSIAVPVAVRAAVLIPAREQMHSLNRAEEGVENSEDDDDKSVDDDDASVYLSDGEELVAEEEKDLPLREVGNIIAAEWEEGDSDEEEDELV